ncbi:MAG: ATP-binding protein [Myxococcota bacterium]|jgi:energy-coupling factor transporter ATP-binding protein EcfA2|nr:ATP-binding protein [Myxococcota bacterium]
MNDDWISWLKIENYGCIKCLELQHLTRLHAFIGPNDSGKSTLLRALRVAVQVASNAFTVQNGQISQPFDPQLEYGQRTSNIGIGFQDGLGMFVTSLGENRVRTFIKDRRGVSAETLLAHGLDERSVVREGTSEDAKTLGRRMIGQRLVRLDPDVMRKRSGLIPDGAAINLKSERGGGLPGIYDAIRDRRIADFASIETELKVLFPSIEALQLKAISQSEKILRVRLTNGVEVAADRMSEGLLYFLGFAALPYLEPVSVLLVEEPENGLHPARIREVVNVLKAISRNTQVLIATHSPLVINELEPEQVSLVTRTENEGTKVTPISKTANFEERNKVYALGELWLSYADGNLEEALVDKAEP